MGCIGGCVGGPKSIISQQLGTHSVNITAEASKILTPIASDCMKRILNKININSIDDFTEKKNISIFERKF